MFQLFHRGFLTTKKFLCSSIVLPERRCFSFYHHGKRIIYARKFFHNTTNGLKIHSFRPNLNQLHQGKQFLSICRSCSTNSIQSETNSMTPSLESNSAPIIQNPDELTNEITSANIFNVDVVLNLVEKYDKQLYSDHVFQALKKISRYAKQKIRNSGDENVLETLHTDQRFQKLCIAAVKLGQHFSNSEIVETVYFLRLLGFNEKSVVVQIFLELSKHIINDLQLEELISFRYSISFFENTPQVFVLSKALDTLGLLRFEDILKYRSIHQLVQYLCLFGGALEQKQSALLMFVLESKKRQIKPSLAFQLLTGMPKMKIEYAPLVDYCIEKVYSRLSNFPEKRLVTLLDVCKELGIENRDFYNSVIEIITESATFTTGDILKLTLTFVQLSFYNTALFEKLATVLDTDTDFLNNSDYISSILNIFAFVGFTNSSVQNILSRLVENLRHGAAEMKISQLFECLFNLAILGKFPEDLLKIVANSDELKNSLDPDDWLLLRVVMQQQGYNLYLEPLEVPESVYKPWYTNRLQSMLLVSVPSSRYIATNVFTPEGLHIEHLVSLDEENNPISFRSLLELDIYNIKESLPLKLESLNIPVNSKRLAIVSLPSTGIIQNTGKLTGKSRLFVDSLKNMGFLTIPINRSEFNKMSERERLKFIKLRLQNPEKYQNVGLFGVGSL